MRITNVYSLIIFACLFIYKNAHCQKFKILKEDPSSVILEFSFDTNRIQDFLINKDIIDFSKEFYCINQLNKPILPIFNFTFELSDSTLLYNLQNSEKTKFKINSIRKGEIAKKRGITSNKSENKFNLINFSEPFVYRNFLGQNLQIVPIQFDSLNNQLICYHKIEIKISFYKESKNNPTISNNNTSLNLTKKAEFYSFKKTVRNLKSIDPSKAEILIIHNDSNTNNAISLANWKHQKGIKTTLFKIDNQINPIDLKSHISDKYSNSPNLKYILLLGNHSEIPAYNYGNIDGDNYFSDSYFGQLTDDFYPELFVGRITGSPHEIKSIINKSIFYEKSNFEGDWMNKSMGIGSNEGLGDGDNGEADWQHLRNIKSKLKDFGFNKVYEFYDGDHGGGDLPGNPDKINIIDSLNEGVSILNYTGHGDDNLMLTSQLSSTDVDNLKNTNKNPFVISVACDNGKFIDGQGTIAEAFLKSRDDQNFTGSIAFCGSSILMDWAPPMLTQDEIVNSIVANDTIHNLYSIGELFYESQIKMLNKYNSLGNGVMQTWILFGDPSIDLKTKIPQDLDISYEYNNLTHELNINSKNDNVLLGLSKENQYIESYKLNKGKNKIILDNDYDSLLLTFTKPNYKTFQDTILKSSSTTSISSTTTINKMNVFPNPLSVSNSEFTIFGISDIQSIKLFDLLGKELQIEPKIELDKIIVKFENLKSGIYLLNIQDNTNHFFTKRIILN